MIEMQALFFLFKQPSAHNRKNDEGALSTPLL